MEPPYKTIDVFKFMNMDTGKVQTVEYPAHIHSEILTENYE